MGSSVPSDIYCLARNPSATEGIKQKGNGPMTERFIGFSVKFWLSYPYRFTVFNRPGLAGAVLQSASSLINSVSLFLLIFKIS